MIPEIDQVYERGDFRRLIQEVNLHDRPMQVIYALYKKQNIWAQDPKMRRTEWWYVRQGYCSFVTWNRWVKKAKVAEAVGGAT